MRIGQVDVKVVAKDMVTEFKEDDVTGMAAQSAYQLIFALPPMLIFFAALSGLVAQYTGVDVFARLMTLAEEALPEPVVQTLDIVLQGITSEASAGLLSFGFILAIWSASSALSTMIKLFNRAYGVEDDRSFFKQKGISLALTIGMAVSVIAAFVLFVFGERLGRWIASIAGLSGAFELIWNIGRWPVIIILIMLALAVLYWAGPAIDNSFRWISPGAVLAMALWLIATFGFSLYLRFSNPGSAYGALGTLVVLLFFLYVSSLILLLGAELNAILETRYNPSVIEDKESPPERQGGPGRVRQRARELA